MMITTVSQQTSVCSWRRHAHGLVLLPLLHHLLTNHFIRYTCSNKYQPITRQHQSLNQGPQHDWDFPTNHLREQQHGQRSEVIPVSENRKLSLQFTQTHKPGHGRCRNTSWSDECRLVEIGSTDPSCPCQWLLLTRSVDRGVFSRSSSLLEHDDESTALRRPPQSRVQQGSSGRWRNGTVLMDAADKSAADVTMMSR